MIAECPHCSADIPVDSNLDSNILTCPSCHQQCGFERPNLPPPPTSPAAAATQVRATQVKAVLESPYRSGGWFVLALILLGGFVLGVLNFEAWLSDNPALAESIVPAGRFYLVAIHFPIVLITIIFSTEVLLLFQRASHWRAGMRYCLWWATLGACLSFFLSLLLAQDSHLSLDSAAVETHRTFAQGMVGALFAALLVKIVTDAKPNRSPALYRLLVAGAAAVVLITGYLGIGMVVGDHFLIPEGAAQEASPH